MKVWAKIVTQQKIKKDVVREFSPARPSDSRGWHEVLAELARPLDLACPVLLGKHVQELARFGRTSFLPSDFLESVAFDRFEVEIFPEKKTPPQE